MLRVLFFADLVDTRVFLLVTKLLFSLRQKVADVKI